MYKIWAHATLQENSASVCEIGFIINKKLPDTLSSLIMVLSQVHRKVCLSAYVCVCVCVCVLSMGCHSSFNTTHTDPDTLKPADDAFAKVASFRSAQRSEERRVGKV